MHITHTLCILFAALTQSCSIKIPIIRNSNRPLCANCVHFTLHDAHFPSTILNYEYGQRAVSLQQLKPQSAQGTVRSEVFGKCKVFGTMDIVTGTIIYDYASLCRENDQKCGMNGTYYEIKSETSGDIPHHIQ